LFYYATLQKTYKNIFLYKKQIMSNKERRGIAGNINKKKANVTQITYVDKFMAAA
jgi:hypothetical protein